MSDPKLFISYSWSSPDHEAWILDLATDLRESGVDVILDKWDLKEGHDAHAFMEKMVTDPGIKKVLLICDKTYADKANGRSGGVGTETQIISAEIYAKQDQNKFVAVVKERDVKGNAYLPAYYRSRIYIDFSDQSKNAENFERLLRWIYDQPLYKKPEIGAKPAFLSEDENIVFLATSVRFKRAVDAIRKGRHYANAVIEEYFSALADELEKMRLDGDADPFDKAVVESIESFLPYRNEAIEIFLTLALYKDNDESRATLHRFFERLIPYLDRPQNVSSYREWDFDNFRFVVHELFLYAIASLIRYERFESAAYLMRNEYYVPEQLEYGRDVMIPFVIFRQCMRSLEHRNKRLNSRPLSVRADLLEQRCKGIGVKFRHLMQADFILFMREEVDRPKGHWNWWPETLLYVGRHSGPFEVFIRSRSLSYFNKAKILLGINEKAELKPVLEQFQNGTRQLPHWEYTSFSPINLLEYDQIATKP